MERSLAQSFCGNEYCEPGEDIYEKNNIEKPENISNDVLTLKKVCLKKCLKVARDEAKY